MQKTANYKNKSKKKTHFQKKKLKGVVYDGLIGKRCRKKNEFLKEKKERF